MRIILALVGFVALFHTGCALTQPEVVPVEQGSESLMPPVDSLLRYRVFLLGDVGASAGGFNEPVLQLLKSRLDAADEHSAVVFLGNNVSTNTHQLERQLREPVEAVRGFKGRVVFIPGNRDWNLRHGQDASAVRAEEAFIEAQLDRGNTFLPDSAFPGPVEVDLDKYLTLVVLDTEWWLAGGQKPIGAGAGYDLEVPEDMFIQLDDVIRRHRKDELLVVGHHAVYSDGTHGGHFPLRAHLFPLTQRWKNAYLPLPVAGSLYVLYRRYIGGDQDFSSPSYRLLRNGLIGAFSQHEGLVYAAGSEHALQYFDLAGQQYVVSGAASKADYVARGGMAAFAASSRGFAVLSYYDDGQVWLVFWGLERGAGAIGRMLYQARLRGPQLEPVPPEAPEAEQAEARHGSIVASAGPQYGAGPLKAFFAGRENRGVWVKPVSVPILDLGRTAGGLTPTARGGGQQTLTLHLEGADGYSYVLRSIDKDPMKTVPPVLRGTFAGAFVRDQIASLFPYSPLVATPLADAAGILHTRPRLVYTPDDPRLGIYRQLVGGQMMFFDVRPGKNVSDVLGLQGAHEAVGADKLYRSLDRDNDDRVDQRAFARARLLDLLISDWDRGRDQWRWAAYDDPDGKGTLYRPIPLDRDWAFNRMDGLFPSLAPYILHRYQGFGDRYGSLRRLTRNGLHQDRRFTNMLTREDWGGIADSLRATLTDGAIEHAVQQLPEPVFSAYGPWLIRTLETRRDKLTDVAVKFYRLNNAVVDVVGSDKHERFDVTRSGDTTQVLVYKTTKEGEVEQLLYRRAFRADETREVRLYGMDGNDQFIITGTVGRGPRVRAVGGPGADTFVSRSQGRGRGRKTWFYDDTGPENVWETGPGTRVVRSGDPALNGYSEGLYDRNYRWPQLFFGSNKDDGLFVGGGVLLIRQAFHKQPFARSHRLVGNVATKTEAFNIEYAGRYVGLVQGWDAVLDAEVHSPKSTRNFYGLGNETDPSSTEAGFAPTRLTQARLAPALFKPLAGPSSVRIGAVLQYTKVNELPVTGPVAASLPPDIFDAQIQVGFSGDFLFEDIDDSVLPMRGFRFSGTAGFYQSLIGPSSSYGVLHADAVFYMLPVSRLPASLALRLGGGRSTGTVPFYETQTLGGKTNLRGYRSTRFSGTSSLYLNNELRVKLSRFATYLANGDVGILGFLDAGRVWVKSETSHVWHRGYGGGLWLRLFDRVMVTGVVGASKEDRTFTLHMGFLY